MHRLRRHPVAMAARFGDCLVLTYALPEEALAQRLGPGLELDALRGHGFLAVALVDAHEMRPRGLPRWMGRRLFLAGYRIFARYRSGERTLRGLRILRSDTDSRLMARAGNRLTGYRYGHCAASVRRDNGGVEVDVQTPDGAGDLRVASTLREAAGPPPGSPFRDLREARRYAGPLPFTFGYEPETHSMVVVEGHHPDWSPRPVDVTVGKVGFLAAEFPGIDATLANAFHVRDVPYRWSRGRVERLPARGGGA